jgi:hypothetical protein
MRSVGEAGVASGEGSGIGLWLPEPVCHRHKALSQVN